MAEKITYISALTSGIESLKAVEGFSPDEIAKLEALKASLERRASGERKPSKEQVANDALRAKIYEAMEPGKAYTLSEINELIGESFSTQKLSGLIRTIEGIEKSKTSGKDRKTLFTKI